jgi:hypothetical protein
MFVWALMAFTRAMTGFPICRDAVVERLEVVLGLLFEPAHRLRCEGRVSLARPARSGMSDDDREAMGAHMDRANKVPPVVVVLLLLLLLLLHLLSGWGLIPLLLIILVC